MLKLWELHATDSDNDIRVHVVAESAYDAHQTLLKSLTCSKLETEKSRKRKLLLENAEEIMIREISFNISHVVTDIEKIVNE